MNHNIPYPVFMMCGRDLIPRRLMQVHDPEGHYAAKALLPFMGKRIIDWQLEALLQSRYVEHVYLLGLTPEQSRIQHPSVTCVPVEITADFPEKLIAGLNWLRKIGDPAEMIIISSSDSPAVRSECVDAYFEALNRLGQCDFVPSLVPEAIVEEAFPRSGRVVARFRDLSVLPGELFALSSNAIVSGQQVIAEIHARRRLINRQTERIAIWPVLRLLLRSPKIWPLILKYLLGLATLADGEKAISLAFDARVKSVIIEDAGFGMDIDLPEDLERVECFLRLSEKSPDSGSSSSRIFDMK